MESTLQSLLDAGHRVTFTRDPDGYVASIGDDDGIGITPETALLAVAPDCECGHEALDHDEESPGACGLRVGRMCGVHGCPCLIYRPAPIAAMAAAFTAAGLTAERILEERDTPLSRAVAAEMEREGAKQGA